MSENLPSDTPAIVELDPTEVALVIGEEDGSMTIRVVPARELDDDATDIPEPHEIAIALAMRLLKDPEFQRLDGRGQHRAALDDGPDRPARDRERGPERDGRRERDSDRRRKHAAATRRSASRTNNRNRDTGTVA